MDLARFCKARDYVGFDDAAASALREFEPRVRPQLDGIVQTFYQAIRAHEHSRVLLGNDPVRLERLERSLRAWLLEGLLGPHDARYLESRSRVGRMHVDMQLSEDLVVTAMNRVRTEFHRIAIAELSRPELERTLRALHQWLDLELAILLDSYRERWDARVRAGERLATVGQFSAAIGHELRTPLAVVDSSMALIEARMSALGQDDAVLVKHHRRVREQVGHCRKTLENLLELARETPLRPVTRPLLTVIQAALELVEVPSGVRVDLGVDPGLLVHADPLQLRDAVRNLIDNAVQAVAPSGHVEVRAAASPEGLELSIADDGPGVPASIGERVFELWFSTKRTGTGLGLALSRKIIEIHGGSLTLEPSNVGATFRLWLPRAVSSPSSGP